MRVEDITRAANDSATLRLIASLLTEIRDRLPYAPERAIPEMMGQLTTMQETAIPLPPARGRGVFTVEGPNGELPDSDGTPGEINPDVTDATIKNTIAVSGWTATVRPPVSYTNALKVQVMAEYGIGGNPSDYELDHLVPLCCGGHPTSQKNLWPQRRALVNGAPLKDITEVLAQHAVLNGHFSLAEVQQGFMLDWTKLHNRLTSNPSVMKLMMGLAPPEEEP